MDSISQITLGAAVGEAVLGRKIGNKAIFLGGFAGTLPDLDILANGFLDEVGELMFHRGISHSVFFHLVAAPLLAWLIMKIYKRETATFKDWTLFFFLCLFTHALLDCFTTYGTQLFQPFTDYPVAFNNIFIADPFYTIPFLLTVIITLFFSRNHPRRRFFNYLGLGISTAYIAISLLTKVYINKVFEYALNEQNIEYSSYLTSPTPLNIVLWYCVAQTENGYHIGYYSPFDKDKNVHFDYLPRNGELIEPIKDQRAIDRLLWFSQGYYVIRQKAGELYFYNIKFGKIGFEGSDEEFVFGFRLQQKEDGEYTFVSEFEPPDENMSEALAMLLKRVKGERVVPTSNRIKF